jgi:RimJ/RimL family protein N-acetyltransferase
MTTLTTSRLRLEPITAHHLDSLYEMDRRPEVMRYISGKPATRAQTAAWITGVERCWIAWNTGWWAIIEASSGRVAGAGCIQHARREAALPDDLETLRHNPLEIGWRLHPDFWRQGLASEAAQRLAAFAFDTLAAPELIASCHPDNDASIRVMHRLGMQYRGMEIWYGEPSPTYVLRRHDGQATTAR